MAEHKKPTDAPALDRAPDSVEDRVGAPTTTEQLNPLEMGGKGQQLSDVDRARVETVAQLAEVRRAGEEEVKKAEVQVLLSQRELIASEQEKRRETAMQEVDAQRRAIAESRERLQPLVVDPATLALEAAMNASLAAALEQDETVPGGAYIVAGRIMDADGRDLGKAD